MTGKSQNIACLKLDIDSRKTSDTNGTTPAKKSTAKPLRDGMPFFLVSSYVKYCRVLRLFSLDCVVLQNKIVSISLPMFPKTNVLKLFSQLFVALAYSILHTVIRESLCLTPYAINPQFLFPLGKLTFAS